MSDYTDRLKLEWIFGRVNLQKWADLDNDRNSEFIRDRITWSCEVATAYINGRMANGRYSVPFTNPDKNIIHLTGLFAGTILYDGRANKSGDTVRDELSIQRKSARRLLHEILTGQLKLYDGISGELLDLTCGNVPFVGGRSTISSYTLNPFYISCNCNGRWCSSCVYNNIHKWIALPLM